MPPVSRSRFNRLLRGFDRSAFEGFVADCWRARGFETTIDDGVLTAVNDGGARKRLLLWHGDASATSATYAELEAIVTNRPASSPDDLPRVLDSDDLRDILLYAIDRDLADDLCEQYFGRPIETDPTPSPLDPLAPTLSIGGGSPVRWSVLAAVALVLLAGVVVSLGAPGLAGPFSAGTSTVGTAAPTLPYWIDQEIRDTPWPEPFGSGDLADPPAWAAANRSVEIPAVITASTRSLRGRSFRFTLVRRQADPDHPLTIRRQTVAVERPGVYLVRYERDNATIDDPELVRSVYVNETGRFVWMPHGGVMNATAPIEQMTTREPQDDELAISALHWLLAAPNPEVVKVVRRDGTTLYWVDLSYQGTAEIERIDGHALIDRSGRVHQVHKNYKLPHGVQVDLVVRYTDVGTTTVEPPAWPSNATSNASATG